MMTHDQISSPRPIGGMIPGPDRPTHPPLIIREGDEQQLYEIAIGAMLSSPRLAGGLLDELSRAAVRPDALVPPDVIGLSSIALCQEQDKPNARWVQIVAPEQADAALGRVSVLSDLGAALLGLAPPESILWRDRVGGLRQLAVLAVQRPEAPPPGPP